MRMGLIQLLGQAQLIQNDLLMENICWANPSPAKSYLTCFNSYVYDFHVFLRQILNSPLYFRSASPEYKNSHFSVF